MDAFTATPDPLPPKMKRLLALSLLLLPALPVHAQSDQPLIGRSIALNAPQRTLPEMLRPANTSSSAPRRIPTWRNPFPPRTPYPPRSPTRATGPASPCRARPSPSIRKDVHHLHPPATPEGMFDFQTRVFSGGSPSSVTVPYFQGRLQIISGWKGTGEEYLFSLTKQTEESSPRHGRSIPRRIPYRRRAILRPLHPRGAH